MILFRLLLTAHFARILPGYPMYIDITGWQDCGKTSLAVKLATRYSHEHRFPIIGDVIFHNMPNCLSLDKADMRSYFGSLVTDEHRNEIIILDEVDTLFSHRFWQQREQAEKILDSFQDEKLNLLIISTSHQGKGFDLLLRDACRLIMMPHIDKHSGITNVTFGYTDQPLKGQFQIYVADIFPNYERWSVVKDSPRQHDEGD